MAYDDEIFSNALKSSDIKLLKRVPKTDLHCHAERGANKNYFECKYHTKIPKPPVLNSIKDMDIWYDANLAEYTKGYIGMVDKYISLFQNAEEDNIKYLAPSFCLSKIKYFDNSIKRYIDFLVYLKEKYAPHVTLLPELQLNRNLDFEKSESLFHEAIKYDFFRSVDLMGDEYLGTKDYKSLYKLAGQLGLVLKAHVGEFGNVRLMENALEDLHLDVINHGLCANNSDNMMNYLAKNEVMLNVCPTSNVLLSRVDSYREHPIKKFVSKGIICTVNTDDLLVFDQTISEEYLNLYKAGTLGIEELNELRKNGLTRSLNKRKRVI